MLISSLQVFAVGFFLGFTGPCLFYCLPVILALGVRVQENYTKTLLGILTFLSARLIAYILLGSLAGVSGFILRQFMGSGFSFYLKPVAGLISIAFGIYVFFYRPNQDKGCQTKGHKILNSGGFLVIGFAVGVSPCLPLLGLLFEITLISKNYLQGAAYGFMFGLGTLISGFLLASVLLGALSWIPKKFSSSIAANLIFKSISALILILFGAVFILSVKR